MLRTASLTGWLFFVIPRDRRGRRHSLVAVLLTACCAVLAGARSYLAIGQWARRAPQDTLARLGVRAAGPLGVRRAPSGSTIRHVLTLVCPGDLADLLGWDPAGAAHLAVDGKCARGSRTDAAPAAPALRGDSPQSDFTPGPESSVRRNISPIGRSVSVHTAIHVAREDQEHSHE